MLMIQRKELLIFLNKKSVEKILKKITKKHLSF